MLTSMASDSRVYTLGVLNPPNRRIRSRTYGGVGGAESRDSPLSRLTASRSAGYRCVRHLKHYSNRTPWTTIDCQKKS
jgi:hypothetical protein